MSDRIYVPDERARDSEDRLYDLLCNIAVDIERIADALEDIAGGTRFELEPEPKVKS